jgi:hypothetical protein
MGKAKRAHHVCVHPGIDGHGLSAFAHPTLPSVFWLGLRVLARVSIVDKQ